MADPVGPLYAAGMAPITRSGYTILFLPDAHNFELQAEKKAAIFYYMAGSVRLARRNGDTGDYAFSMIHFVGRHSDGAEDVSGGLLGFSTTTAPPGAVLQEAQDAILDMYRGSSDRWWGWRNSVAPIFRPAPIVSNFTTVTNLSPNPDGSIPVVPPPTPTPTPSPGPPPVSSATGLLGATSPRTVPWDIGVRANNLDPWFVNMQGQGPGSVSPLAQNAYSGLMGSLPAALAWAAFHGGTGAFSVWQIMKLRVVSPVITLDIVGDWSRIQDHFSAAAHAGGWWWSADIKAEFNRMRINGDIQVNMFVDTTLPDHQKLTEALDKRSDLVFQKFLDEAQKKIFDPPAFNEEPAKAGGFFGFGGGSAMKLRRDRVDLRLEYHEKREIAYLQEYPVSGQLEGLHDEITANPDAEKKYFTTLYLDDWERKVSRTVVPMVNWPAPDRNWVGQPCAFLSAQVGYPNTQGVVQWDGHLFQRTDDPAKANWTTAVAMKNAADVKNPPPGWTPDKTYVKRRVHCTEPPSPLQNPFVRVDIEKNVIDLDPGELGTLTNDINLEVRMDEVGGLTVGPLFLNVDLENNKQFVEVTFQALGKKDDGSDRAPVTFSWAYTDQYEPRFWMVFTGQPDYLPRYRYQVRVIVKGSIFTKGMEWLGPWQDAMASGPLMVSVPTPEDEGVIVKSLAREASPTVTAPAARPLDIPPAHRTLSLGDFAENSGAAVFESYRATR